MLGWGTHNLVGTLCLLRRVCKLVSYQPAATQLWCWEHVTQDTVSQAYVMLSSKALLVSALHSMTNTLFYGTLMSLVGSPSGYSSTSCTSNRHAAALCVPFRRQITHSALLEKHSELQGLQARLRELQQQLGRFHELPASLLGARMRLEEARKQLEERQTRFKELTVE